VCQLAPDNAPFPRRQMLLAQWGLVDRLVGDPAVWLCHQCNDCTVHCPRDARPGDVMQTVRNLVVQRLAVPGIMGKLVADAASSWIALLGVPIAYWVVLLGLYNGLAIPQGEHLVYEEFVPHVLIYITYFTVTGLVALFAGVAGLRFWRGLEGADQRKGSFLSHLVPVAIEIMTHKRFGECDASRPRKLGHLALFWGFVGAAVTSAFIIVYMYIEGKPLPVPLAHPYKILGNISAVALVIGGVWLLYNRMTSEHAGNSTAFDNFFLGVVLLLIATGILVEIGRFVFDPMLACYLYVLHLGAVLCLFITFPHSKFAHLLYRTLAMVHERMVHGVRR
jgi:quinone-modifying oxidoreductase subunit QmoC